METARLRLVFEDPNILSKSQKKQGLKRSWFLLKPQHETISDLTSDLLDIFYLRESCTNGLILYMDGFALPPFESICILKDKDIVSVKKKGRKSTEIIKSVNDFNLLEESEFVEHLTVNTGGKLLSNEEFGKETGGYESESEEYEREHVPLENQAQVESTPIENMVSKKRKGRDKLPSSRKKKSKLAGSEKSPVFGDDGIDIRPKKRKRSHKQKVVSNDKVVEKENAIKIQGEPENTSGPEIDESSDDQTNLGRFSHPQNTSKGSDNEPMTTTEVKKLPSRSARRKKAKRRWLREQAKTEKEKLQSKQMHEKDDQQSRAKENLKFSEEHRQPIGNNDVEDNMAPMVVRRGHIRFEPLEEEDSEQAVQQSQIPVNIFQWNGITSKKKGQKWGMERTSCMKRNDNTFSQLSSEMVEDNKNATVTDDVDFDKLTPYSSSPKEGDLVAYRLIELSSTWTPELCSFRVGEISHYNAESNLIKLTPVPGYPNTSEERIDQEVSELLDASLYGEDGSLEIDYSSLVDIRLVKHGNPNVLTRQSNGNKEAAIVSAAPPTAQANGPGNVWDEINEALSAKKAELSKDDGWSRADSSGTSGWSYRALRRSALGPTVAFLRAQNGI
ncbi:Sphere organelles protein-related, putative isoform 2 [Hibiscus syriacus]|uniref:Sphere organelles protein-related, putative isoform 2 n=1 Tax=Hibiscus syriacus TaxID=106335 RepID=A0A6A2Y9Y8_HIBSY|nr:coilin-like [Hibiscus syriacus]KAE8667234.1 Sphere organelles protein-related, putative isoform 2 [Hibiscus syriacus]